MSLENHLSCRLFESMKKKKFLEYAKNTASKKGGKALYNEYINSIKNHLFDNEQLFKTSLFCLKPYYEFAKEFWLEAIKTKQFREIFAQLAAFTHEKETDEMLKIYGKELIKPILKEFTELLNSRGLEITVGVSLDEYLSQESRQKMKEHYLSTINKDYKPVAENYLIHFNFPDSEFPGLEEDDKCDLCKGSLNQLKIPNVKGEYMLCKKDNALMLNYSQVLRMFCGWTIEELGLES